MYRPTMLEVQVRQQELLRDAAQARLVSKRHAKEAHDARVSRPFGLKLAPAR